MKRSRKLKRKKKAYVAGGSRRSALYNRTAILKRFAEAYNIFLRVHIFIHTGIMTSETGRKNRKSDYIVTTSDCRKK